MSDLQRNPDLAPLEPESVPVGCLPALFRVVVRLLFLALAGLFFGSVFGLLPEAILSQTRPLLVSLFDLVGVPLGPPICLEPAVRELLFFCALAPVS